MVHTRAWPRISPSTKIYFRCHFRGVWRHSDQTCLRRWNDSSAAIIRWHRKAFDMLSWQFWHHTIQRHQICHPSPSSAPQSHRYTFHHLLTVDIMLFYLYTHHVLDFTGYLAHDAQHCITTNQHSQEFLDMLPLPVLIICMLACSYENLYFHRGIERPWPFTTILLRGFVLWILLTCGGLAQSRPEHLVTSVLFCRISC